MKYQLLLLLLIASTVSHTISVSSFDQPSDIVSFSILDVDRGWIQINSTHNGYEVFSDDETIDGISSNEDFFPWYQLADSIEVSDFFNQDLQEQNATVLLYINGEGNNNQIKLAQLPNNTETISITVLLVNSFLNKVIGDEIDSPTVWPVTLGVLAFGFNPREWQFTALIQRGNDNLDEITSQNASLFATPQLDLNDISENTLRAALIKQSMSFSIAASGTTTSIQFDPFAYIYSNSTEADPLSFIIILDNGAFLGIQNTTLGFVEVIGQAEILNAWRIVEGLNLTNTPTSAVGTTSTDNSVVTTSTSQNGNTDQTTIDFRVGLFILPMLLTIRKRKRLN